MRVLIIEDDKKLAKIIADVLKEEKIHSDITNDGETGLEASLRGAYDVAIIDWMLPGRDGPSICRAIRAARLKCWTFITYCSRPGGRPGSGA